ncbi:MAG: endonuclease III [Bacilli bacterium]|nr:endonuclease III [Bacilli bacterium]
MNKEFFSILDEIVPNPQCTLEYSRDYELLIATVLSAQCTDERVNKVTKVLFEKYDIFALAKLKPEDIIDIIRPCGNMNKKSKYIVDIAKKLVSEYNGQVPNNREFLESLPGVGRKTANVVLGNIYNEPTFAVDTHVERVSKRLGLAASNDDVLTVENKLMQIFPKEKWIYLHHQLLLFGRHTCLSRNPLCQSCKMKKYCKKMDA